MSAVIKLEHIDVTFKSKARTVQAVHDVSLEVEKGEIYGIVGYSGAGKSTLVRVINLLQRPTKGQVEVNQQDLLSLKAKPLRQARKKIGMIFQHFNLMNARTIADNVDYPLKSSNLTKAQRRAKVADLLDLVGLADKKNAYPAQLSGGQKQRVAIARALANDPEILISDEATSALDPKTTLSILELLRSLNQRLGLTIVLITHEMQAVKEICQKVAVMENGQIIEHGDLLQVFSQPQKQLTKDFINTATQVEQALAKVLQQPAIQHLRANERLVELSYIGDSTDQPLITELYKRYLVTANILFGNVEILQGTPVGNLIVTLSGAEKNLNAATEYLRQAQVNIREIKVGRDVIPLVKQEHA